MNKILKCSLAAIILFSCSTAEKPADFDYGKVENSKYTNTYFDFEIAIPEGWVVQTQDRLDQLSEKGKELVAGDDGQLKAALKATDVNTANLLGVFQYELGSAVEYNPSFMIVAENVANFPGLKTGSEYLFHAKKLLDQGQMKYDYIDSEFAKEVISGLDFYQMNAAISYAGIDIKQTYYSTVIKGFSFNVIISYSTDEQKNALLKTISTMRFKNA
jgi:hypothetical protein